MAGSFACSGYPEFSEKQFRQQRVAQRGKGPDFSIIREYSIEKRPNQ